MFAFYPFHVRDKRRDEMRGEHREKERKEEGEKREQSTETPSIKNTEANLHKTLPPFHEPLSDDLFCRVRFF